MYYIKLNCLFAIIKEYNMCKDQSATIIITLLNLVEYL